MDALHDLFHAFYYLYPTHVHAAILVDPVQTLSPEHFPGNLLGRRLPGIRSSRVLFVLLVLFIQADVLGVDPLRR